MPKDCILCKQESESWDHIKNMCIGGRKKFILISIKVGRSDRIFAIWRFFTICTFCEYQCYKEHFSEKRRIFKMQG